MKSEEDIMQGVLQYCEAKSKEDDIAPQELSDRPNLKKPSADDNHWGYHLLLDMGECNENINNEDQVSEFISELVKKLKMKTIGKLIIHSIDNKTGRGISAVQIITTSTITFHGDNDKLSVYLDVFSCKSYDPKIVFGLVKEYFEPKHVGYKWIFRDAGAWPKKQK